MKLLNNIGKEILNRAIVLERLDIGTFEIRLLQVCPEQRRLASFLHGRRISARASRL